MTVASSIRISDDELAAGRRAYELDRKHVLHSWSAQAQLKPMTITRAEGSFVWDGDGNRLLDFSSPEMNELVAACKSRGLLPFANFNRIHVVPPLNITAEDAHAGLDLLDEALASGCLRGRQL